jgi:hypothetical protein
MSHKHYTPDQIEELLRNPYVAKCSSKYISYTYECKVKAIELSMNQYILSREIFALLGFPLYVSESNTSKDSIKAWKRIAQNK